MFPVLVAARKEEREGEGWRRGSKEGREGRGEVLQYIKLGAYVCLLWQHHFVHTLPGQLMENCSPPPPPPVPSSAPLPQSWLSVG